MEGTLVFHPINQTLFGFGFRSFRFIGNYTYLYVHCKAFVCDRDEKTPQCDRSCGVSRSVRVNAVDDGTSSVNVKNLEEDSPAIRGGRICSQNPKTV